MNAQPRIVLVTGADGLLARHARVGLRALNGAARFAGLAEPWSVRLARHVDVADPARLASLADGVHIVLHFAGINRADDDALENGNRLIAERLASALDASASRAHVLYANSTHANNDTPYGRGKAAAARVLALRAERAEALFSDLLLPHVFGEGGRPYYNSVTATLCRQIVDAVQPTIHPGASVELVHAGSVFDRMMQLVECAEGGSHRMQGQIRTVPELYERLSGFAADRAADRFPAVSETLDVALFNTLVAAGLPDSIVTPLDGHVDSRGTLFEVAKGGAEGQTFISWTEPDIERGNHFHRYKIERFVVLQGSATIRLRHVLEDRVHAFAVDGSRPVAIDMPALHTHSIVNTGSEPLLTLFWAHEVFDPDRPDTWACPVLVDGVQQIDHVLDGRRSVA